MGCRSAIRISELGNSYTRWCCGSFFFCIYHCWKWYEKHRIFNKLIPENKSGTATFWLRHFFRAYNFWGHLLFENNLHVCLTSLPYVAEGFLLTEQTLWKKELILARRRLIFWLVKSVFFSPFFWDFCQFVFCLVDTSFSKIAFIPAGENGFLAGGDRFIVFTRFSSQWKPSLKLVEANF